MTSPTNIARRQQAREELRIFNALPRPLRDAINNATASVKASTVRDALLRGVSEEEIVKTLTRSHKS